LKRSDIVAWMRSTYWRQNKQQWTKDLEGTNKPWHVAGPDATSTDKEASPGLALPQQTPEEPRVTARVQPSNLSALATSGLLLLDEPMSPQPQAITPENESEQRSLEK